MECVCCGDDLGQRVVSVTAQQLQDLAFHLDERVFLSQRKYYTTTDKTDENFQKIMSHGPFDYVIDGENLLSYYYNDQVQTVYGNFKKESSVIFYC